MEKSILVAVMLSATTEHENIPRGGYWKKYISKLEIYFNRYGNVPTSGYGSTSGAPMYGASSRTPPPSIFGLSGHTSPPNVGGYASPPPNMGGYATPPNMGGYATPPNTARYRKYSTDSNSTQNSTSKF